MTCVKVLIFPAITFVSGCSNNHYAQVASWFPNAGGIRNIKV